MKIMVSLVLLVFASNAFAQGLLATLKDSNTQRSEPGAFYTIRFELTATDGDVYLPATSGFSSKPEYGFNLFLEPSGSATRSDSAVYGRTFPSAPAGYFEIPEGQTSWFDVSSYVEPNTTGFYAVTLKSVNWATSPGGALSSLPLDFKTPLAFLEAVPEPSTYTLGAIGVITILLCRWRK